MPFNLVLLPLLGGYWFTHRFYLIKFRAQTLSGYRILLESAVAGVFLLCASRGFTYGFGRYPWAQEANRLFKLVVSFPFGGTALGSFLISIVVVAVLNKVGDRGVAALKAYRKYGGELIGLLLRVQVGDERGPFPVMMTLKNRKVYTGFILGMPIPAQEHQYIKILPSASGFRADNSLSIQWTTYYGEVYKKLQAGEFGVSWDPEDFVIVIPVAEIMTVTRFVEGIPPEEFACASDRPAPPSGVLRA